MTKAVRRLCCERLDDALELLEKGEHFDAVHDVRKKIKRLRALLRLVRSGIGETAYHEATNAMRSSAVQLNAMRDARVRSASLKDLARWSKGRIPRHALSKIQNALRQSRQAEEQKLGKTLDLAKQYLLEARLQSERLKVGPNNWKALGPGLKKIYSRGREAQALAKRRPSPENFHEWRKRVKDLSSQLRLVCPTQPRKITARIDELDHLGSLLGDDHDLFMLGQFVGKDPMLPREKRAIEQVIAERQKELRSGALELGASFYAKNPNRFCRQVGKGWKSWRGK